jgi:LacI family transcriptional regulator
MKRATKRPGPPHVACLVETSTIYGREILRGVSRYVREAGPWAIFLEQRSLHEPAPRWLKGWDGDGILSRLSSPQAAMLLRETGIPTVDLNDQVGDLGLPQVRGDHEAIGTLAASHLLERGFTNFAFFGFPGLAWSQSRFEGFASAVRAVGFPCHEYDRGQRTSWSHRQRSWEAEVDGVARWISSMPKPLGMMTCNDLRGVQALDACLRAGVAVPEEVAVIGVDNETLACELAYPPLSSVVPDARRIGYEAAALLDRLMKGEGPKNTGHVVAPTGVVTRQSTDVTALADPSLVAAVRYIREHACEGIGVADVLRRVTVSKSVLQRRFRTTLGRTIHEMIAETRLHRVRQLLAETELPLSTIAERAGFAHAEYLTTVFREATGTTPAAYRREHGSTR